DQSDQSSPAISRQLTLAVAKKFNAQNSRGQKRYRQPKGDHEIMLAHDEDRSRGIMRLRERVVCAISFHYPFCCLCSRRLRPRVLSPSIQKKPPKLSYNNRR